MAHRNKAIKAAYIDIVQNYNQQEDVLTYRPSLIIKKIQNGSINAKSNHAIDLNGYTLNNGYLEKDLLIIAKEVIDSKNITIGDCAILFNSEKVIAIPFVLLREYSLRTNLI